MDHHHKPHMLVPVSAATARQGGEKLMIRRCTACRQRLAPVITTCTACRSTALEWVISCGRGSIVSWKVVHRPTRDSDLSAWETSTVAIVELDDGPWIYATLEGEVPPPSKKPVRVRFTPKPDCDRFPVFTTTTDEEDLADRGRSQNRCTRNRKETSSTTETTEQKAYDPTWVRSCLHQCDFLAATRSIDADAKSLVRYAIRWAPFGGASAQDLLVTFGITRWLFVRKVHETLQPRNNDSRTVRTSKRNLMDALSWGWRMYPDSSAAQVANP